MCLTFAWVSCHMLLWIFLFLFLSFWTIAWDLCLVLLYAPWNWFWPNFKELSVQDTLKHPSHHFKYLVLKRKSVFKTKNSLAESFYNAWWIHLAIFTRCYATKFYTWILGDIGKLVPCFDLVMIFHGVCMIWGIILACSNAFHRVLKSAFHCFSLVKSFVSNFSSLEFSFPYFCAFLACH